MYINNVNYSTDLNTCQSLRSFMMSNVYNNIENINFIMNSIASKIDCLDIIFDPTRFEISINIKKTTMRRAKGYKADSMYYYGIVNSVFKEFFANHPTIANSVSQIGIELYNGDNASTNFSSICQVYCIGDKSVVIKL